MIDEKCWADAHLLSLLTSNPQADCYQELIRERKTVDLETQLHREREKRQQLTKLLESLTPGGSEFHSDPERCIQWVKDRLATVSKQVKKRKEAEAENAKLRATIAAMQDALEEVKARCELRRQDDDAHYENYYEAKQALAAAGYGGDD